MLKMQTCVFKTFDRNFASYNIMFYLCVNSLKVRTKLKSHNGSSALTFGIKGLLADIVQS